MILDHVSSKEIFSSKAAFAVKIFLLKTNWYVLNLIFSSKLFRIVNLNILSKVKNYIISLYLRKAVGFFFF